MNPQTTLKYTKLKVIGGFLLLSIVVSVAIHFLFNEVNNFILNGENDYPQAHSHETYQEVVTHLYNAESHIGPMIIDQEDIQLFQQEITLAQEKMEALKSTTDSASQLQIDTIQQLLKEKEACIVGLGRLTNHNELEKIYKNNILHLIDSDTPLKEYQKLEKKTILRQDTILQNRPSARRRGFFRRLFHLYEDLPPDTTILTYSAEYTYIDSLINYYNPLDSIIMIFNEIENDIADAKRVTDRMLLNEVNELRAQNNEITLRLKQILSNLDQKAEKNREKILDARQERSEQTSRFLSYLAVVAALIIIVFLLMIWNDLSKSQRYRKAVEQKNEELQSMMRQQENLMHSITHDIKAPIGSIIGYLELITGTAMSEKQHYYVENMRNSTEHVLQLTNNLLDNGRLNAGHIELNLFPFETELMFRALFNTFLPVATKKGIDLKLNYQFPPRRVNGDPLRIRQIVENLVSNAIKFTEKGEVEIRVEQTEAQEMVIEVRDTGRGITPENQQRIFQEYTRIEETKEEMTDGFGIGLSIVQKLVKRMEGKIEVESEPGKGSIFRVTLPYQEVPDTDTEDETTQETNSYRPRILFIDDDKTMLSLIKEMLSKENVEVTLCHTSNEAMRQIEENDFDLLFTDIQMPDSNGFDIARLVRSSQRNSAIPIIALSAQADLQNEVNQSDTFTDYLSKPFTARILLSCIEKHTKCSVLREISDKTSDNKNRFGALLEYACGDKEAELNILTTFVNESTENLQRLTESRRRSQTANNQADKAEAEETLRKTTHKMRPLFSLLQVDTIAEWLSHVEKGEETEEVFEVRCREIAQLIEECRTAIGNY